MFGPIQRQVLDWSDKRYNFDVSFNPATNSNMFIGLKGSSGSGTDLSFNEFFFKQPGNAY